MGKSATIVIIKIFKAGTNLRHPLPPHPQNVILFLIHHVGEKKAVSEAFTWFVYYDGPMIPCSCLIAEYVNPNYMFGDQENDHWLGPWTYWSHCKLAFGQN